MSVSHTKQPLNELRTSSTPSFIQHADLESISSIAVSVRKKSTAFNHSCTVDREVDIGTHTAAWLIHFEDGVDWVFRTPLIDYSPILEKRIQSDVCGIRLIQSKTNIPIPLVIDFSVCPENPFGRPYVIFEKPGGLPLSDLWFYLSGDKRRIVFESLASTMSLLKALEFDRIGSLYFDETLETYSVGPKIPSYEEISDGYITTRGTYPTTHTYLLGEIRRQLSLNVDQDRKLFLALMHIFSGFLPDHHFDEQPFVLSSPNLDLHSVFVDEDGNVTAITEWESVFIGPREGGYAKYPSWITLDWDPVTDRYQSEKTTEDDLVEAEEESGSVKSAPEPDPLVNVPEHGDFDQPAPRTSNGSSTDPTLCNIVERERRNCEGDPAANDDSLSQEPAFKPPKGTLHFESGAPNLNVQSLDHHSSPTSSNMNDIDPSSDSSGKDIAPNFEALRNEYLVAFTEIDPTSARYTRFSHIFNALEKSILSAKPGDHILGKFKQFILGPKTKQHDGQLLEIPTLLERLSMGKWIHDL